MDIEVNDVALAGVILDVPAYMLPPEVWTYGHNVCYVNEGVERMRGYTQIFGTPSIAPHFVMPISTGTSTYWVYVSLTAAAVYDGVNHTVITRAVGGAYTANDTVDWNGTILGGVLILNNGLDVPQYWAAPPNVAVTLANLPNWDATWRAKVVRSFGSFLIAFNITKAGVNYPHLASWSHPADPGTYPSSWDVADATKDTGDKDFSDVNSGIIVDALQLGDTMFVYKENAVWRMRFIGGRFIFSFATFLDTVGCLATRCVTITGDGKSHVFVTQDDIMIHNGSVATSILNRRQRASLFAELDNTYFRNSFIFTKAAKEEIWFCYPTTGNQYPNKALVWNYGHGKIGAISSADVAFRNVGIGLVDENSTETWETGVDQWDTDTGPWSQITRRNLVLCDPANTKFYRADTGDTRDGSTFTATLRRKSLGILAEKRNKEPINDFSKVKMSSRIYPKLQGGPINIRLSSQEYPEGPETFTTVVSFDPTTQVVSDPLDTPISGRALGVEYESTAATWWRLDGYKLSVEELGEW